MNVYLAKFYRVRFVLATFVCAVKTRTAKFTTDREDVVVPVRLRLLRLRKENGCFDYIGYGSDTAKTMMVQLP